MQVCGTVQSDATGVCAKRFRSELYDIMPICFN